MAVVSYHRLTGDRRPKTDDGPVPSFSFALRYALCPLLFALWALRVLSAHCLLPAVLLASARSFCTISLTRSENE